MGTKNNTKTKKPPVIEDVKDIRSESAKKLYPWWWRDTASSDNPYILSDRKLAILFYRYELGRRYLIRIMEYCESQIPHMVHLSKKNPEVFPLGFFSYFYELSEHSIIDDDTFDPMTREKLSKLKLRPSKDRPWERCSVLAWNLECPWKVVERELRSTFEHQRQRAGVKTIKKSQKLQKPNWRSLEIWDFWEDNLDFPGYTNGDSHFTKVAGIKRKAKEFHSLAENIAIYAMDPGANPYLEWCQEVLRQNTAIYAMDHKPSV